MTPTETESPASSINTEDDLFKDNPNFQEVDESPAAEADSPAEEAPAAPAAEAPKENDDNPSESPKEGTDAGSEQSKEAPKAGEKPSEGDDKPAPDASPSGGGNPSDSKTEFTQEQKDQLMDEMSGGRFKTVAEFEEAKVGEKLDLLSTVEQERDKYKVDAEKDHFTNDFAREVNSFMAKHGTKGLDAFLKLQSFDTEKGNKLEAIQLKMTVEHPELDIQQVNSVISKKYKVGGDYTDENIKRLKSSDEEDDKKLGALMEREKSDADIELTMDHAKAVEFIEDKKADMTNDTLSETEAKEAEAKTELAAQWKPKLESMVGDMKSLDFQIDGAKDEYKEFKFEIPDEHREELVGEIPAIIEMNGMDMTPENIQAAEEILKNLYFSWNRDEIMSSYGNHIKSMSEENWAAENHNPSAGKSTEDIPPAPEKSQQQSAIDEIMEFERAGA